jgi:spore germination protein YaaH
VAPLLLLASAFLLPSALAQKTEFWMGNGRASVTSFLAHKDKIDIISPTWYQIDADGLVTGEPQPTVLKAAHDAHMTIIPLFAIFDHVKIHALLNDPKAQEAMNQAFLRECEENGYNGINYDVEDVMWTDRDGLSAMVAKTAALLHAHHLQVQIDVVPNAPGHAGETAFGKWIYQEWRGGYDLKALAASVDLICLMTYDQHTHWTTPGPVGGWVYISEPDSIFLRDTFGAKTLWDEEEHTPWFYFTRDQMREYVYYTDTRAFMDRYNLAHADGIQGVCSWVLGEEDPAIWDSIPARR